MKRILILIAFVTIVVSCNTSKKKDKAKAVNTEQTIYYGGDIITMEGDTPIYVEAIVQENGGIVFVGDKVDALKEYGTAEQMDLKGKTMVPGFIDAHAHFSNFGLMALGAQVLPPPDAGANDISTMINILKEWATPENMAISGWIYGMGFDDSVLAEKRFPTKEDLDKVSTDVPVMVIHISGHFAVMNSKGLEEIGITSESKNPNGGLIRRIAGSNEPNGVLEELAAIPHMLAILTPKNKEAERKILGAGQDMAISYGYTTAQEGRGMTNSDMLASAAEESFFKIDVINYIDYAYMDDYMSTKWVSKDYVNNYRIGGVKLTLDGSPQGRTAWRTIPYVLPPDGAKKGYLGYPAFSDDKDVEAIYERAFKNNWQILSHANGDAAMDQMIRAMKVAAKKYGNTDRRSVLIHGQYVRDDQLDSYKDLDVIASLFPLHTFYWGDWHKEIIGDELGNKISPTRTALNKGLRITTHTDAPVALPNLMRMAGISVTRLSRSGVIIGENERLTPYEALKSITEWSAYQHFEDDRKGTLTIGKLADLVILDNNPLKVAVEKIQDIIVLKTIKEGEVVYNK